MWKNMNTRKIAVHQYTVKILKLWTPEKNVAIVLKFEPWGFTIDSVSKRWRRNVKQCRPWSDCSSRGAVWSGSTLFAQTYLSEKLGSLRNTVFGVLIKIC